jgi:hypothetical protein
MKEIMRRFASKVELEKREDALMKSAEANNKGKKPSRSKEWMAQYYYKLRQGIIHSSSTNFLLDILSKANEQAKREES